MNRISRLGAYYKRLKEFISLQTEATLSFRPPAAMCLGRRKQSGLYLEALAHGIDLVLEGYRRQIVRVEKKVEGVLPCFHILHPFTPPLSLSYTHPQTVH